MGIGMTLVIIVFMGCIAFLIDKYMSYCSKNKINLFANPEYDKRISALEKVIKELMQDK